MNFKITEYQVKRIRKEAEIQINGKVIYLKEIYNGSGKDIICTAFLYNGRKEIDKRYYSIENRQQAIEELAEEAKKI
jgi:hypothetical protein